MKRISVLWLVLIQWVLAYEWLHSGWGKWTGEGFMNNIGNTLQGFAEKTSHAFYADFLQSVAIPNASLFGTLIRSGEMLVGIVLLIGGIILLSRKRLSLSMSWVLALALFSGALMNLNFFLAAGSTSPSTWGVNMIMGLIQAILGVFYIAHRRELSS